MLLFNNMDFIEVRFRISVFLKYIFECDDVMLKEIFVLALALLKMIIKEKSFAKPHMIYFYENK